jgi:aspartate/methionine/tyrosine aminotransferase
MAAQSEILDLWGNPEPSAIAEAVAHRQKSGSPIFDLISPNPAAEGFQFPHELLQAAFNHAIHAAAVYFPDALGRLDAREAVADYHAEGATAADVLLTPGTSMAYWYCFRILAGSNAEVLCPSPTYPLFDDLARLAGINVRRYHLHRSSAGWELDPDEIRFQVTQRVKAICVVSPHNPTGHVASEAEMQDLCEIADEKGIPVIFDEVFREFTHADLAVSRPQAGVSIVLNGFSKMFSLPGLKAGWMIVRGNNTSRVREFKAAAEYISDCFLPVSDFTAAVMVPVLRQGVRETRRMAELMTLRMAKLLQELADCGIKLNKPQAGPYLCIPLPGDCNAERTALELIQEHGIVSHPGTLYGFSEPMLVITCIKRDKWPVHEIASVALRNRA